MTWVKELITDGEIDALRLVATQAWSEDTEYPFIQKRGNIGEGQCYVTSVWLQSKLGGFVGKKNGHFAWLSPDQSYYLDLTGNHTGIPTYEKNSGYKPYSMIENERTARFTQRANDLFNHLPSVVKIASDAMVGDAFPGQEPEKQALIDQQYWHDEPGIDPEDTEYKFFYANGDLEVAPSKDFDHDDLREHLGIDDDYSGPMGIGYVVINNHKATWQVKTNMNLRDFVKILKEYNKQVGWNWGGMTDISGEPINDDFAPDKKARVLNYVWTNDHLYIGKTSHAALAIKANADNPLVGTITVKGNKAIVNPPYIDALESLFEWSADQNLTLLGSSNNLVERNETMEDNDLGIPNDRPLTNPVEGDAENDDPKPPPRTEDGVIRCPDPRCADEEGNGPIFGSVEDYERHRRKEHGGSAEVKDSDGGFPSNPNMDLTHPPHFTPQQPEATFPVEGSVTIIGNKKMASRVDGFNKYDEIFGYDPNDRFYVSYRNGSPVGYGIVGADGEIKMIQSSVKRQGTFKSILSKIESHYPYLYSHLMHEWEQPFFKERGWTNARGLKWVKSAREPKDLIEAPIPFVYDIAADKFETGRPGERTADIPGDFTPGGIVEGEYAKGGKVTIYTATNMPYSVNHMLSLWYATYPELIIKNVYLEEDGGKTTKLASK